MSHDFKGFLQKIIDERLMIIPDSKTSLKEYYIWYWQTGGHILLIAEKELENLKYNNCRGKHQNEMYDVIDKFTDEYMIEAETVIFSDNCGCP